MSAPLSSNLAIKNWKPAKTGEARSTGGRDGLYVRGWPSGTKAFYLRLKGTWLKLGDYPDTTLSAAREIALVGKRLQKNGFGKRAIHNGLKHACDATQFEQIVRGEMLGGLSAGNTPSVPTYDELWEAWFTDVEPTLQDGPSRRRPRAIHEQHISPVIGARPINAIRRREIHDMLAPMFRKAPVSAGHALGHVSKVFELAITREFREENPTPPRSQFPKRVTPIKRHGTLPAEQMPSLWAQVQESNASLATQLAILTAMVTAHRIGVVVMAEWTHIDLQTGIWTVPERDNKEVPGLMKSGNAYSLRLPDGLVARLQALKEENGHGAFVFESPTTAGHITPNALLKILKRYDPSISPLCYSWPVSDLGRGR